MVFADRKPAGVNPLREKVEVHHLFPRLDELQSAKIQKDIDTATTALQGQSAAIVEKEGKVNGFSVLLEEKPTDSIRFLIENGQYKIALRSENKEVVLENPYIHQIGQEASVIVGGYFEGSPKIMVVKRNGISPYSPK